MDLSVHFGYPALNDLMVYSRLIEVHIFRRFLRDNICYEITLPEEQKEFLGSIIEGLLETGDRGTLKEISTKSLYPVHGLVSRCLQVANQIWSDLSSITYKCLSKPFPLIELQFKHLKNTHEVLYPDAEVKISRVSFQKSHHLYRGTDIYAQPLCLHFGNCSFNNRYLKPKPGLVEFYLLHNVLVDREYNQHLLAKVQLIKATKTINYFGNPVEVWHAELF